MSNCAYQASASEVALLPNVDLYGSRIALLPGRDSPLDTAHCLLETLGQLILLRGQLSKSAVNEAMENALDQAMTIHCELAALCIDAAQSLSRHN